MRGTHEPIVSRELFDKVQAIKQVPKKSAQAKKVPYTENILRGRIFCGHCGKNLHRHRQRCDMSYIFDCISNYRIAKDTCKSNIHMKETDLLETILTIIQREAETVIGKNVRLMQHDDKLAEQKAGVDKEISDLRKAISKSRGFLSGLYENLVTGILTSHEYRSMKADYEQNISAAMERIQALQEQQKELEDQVSRSTSLADLLADIDGNTALTSLLVNQLIERITVNSPEDRITVNSPEDISIQFRFDSGFDRIDEVLANE